MACFTQKSAQVLQKVQEPRKNFRVTSRPSSVSTEVVEMAPPALTRVTLRGWIHFAPWMSMRPG